MMITSQYVNEMMVEFDAISQNESFARVVIAAFLTPLNPNMEELADVRTAVSEAVTNAIIHGYPKELKEGVNTTIKPKVRMQGRIDGKELTVVIEDDGVGIENLNRAMEPLYTSRPDLERSGMGFAFMEAFMDDLQVNSAPGEGTKVIMKKKLE